MESEKVKEIKKALEVYGNENKGITILRSGEIQSISYADILTYINELESENESCYEVLADLKAIIKQQNDRIAEFEKENGKQLKQFAERLKEKLEEYRLENEYFIKDEPNGNLWQLNASVFCIEVTQDGGLVDETLKELQEE